MSRQMLTFANSTERTIPQFVELFKQGGWKVIKVFRPVGGAAVEGAKVIGVPDSASSNA